MSKPVLGRGLGELMQGQAVSGRPAADGTPSADSGELSPGFQRLVAPRTTAETDGNDAAVRLARLRERLAHLKPALLLADFVLCALPAWFAFSRKGTLGALDLLLCGAAVFTGAALGFIALTLDEDAC